jgi:ATP-dependent DNA ligase
MVTQIELRDAIDWMKEQSGTGSTGRKKEKFREIYEEDVAHLLAGERYDDAGVGPATARNAVENVFGSVPDAPTLSESLAELPHGASGNEYYINTLPMLVRDLDSVARKSGNRQQEVLEKILERQAEPSLATLALLDDESIGLGTSQMRGAFFDGSADERRHHEAFVSTTEEFIRLAQKGALPTRPIVGRPFDPMLAKPESQLPDDKTGLVYEPKLDGYRVLIHVKQEETGPRAYAFTRRREDVTGSLPELNEIDWPDSGEYIFDAEVIAEDGSYKTTSSRVGRKEENVERDVDMEFAVFDILVKDGQYVADESYLDRQEILHETQSVYSGDSRIYTIPAYANMTDEKYASVSRNYEGLIWKEPQSSYEFGKRSSSWVKQKNQREHIDVRVVDLVEATGEQAGQLGKFVAESKEGAPLGGVGTGFTDEEAKEIWENPGEWIHGTIEVSAEAYDPDGDGGLRFPVFERDRRDDGEADNIEKIEDVLPKP